MSEVIRQKNKKINKNRIISIVILICSLACLIYCGGAIYDYALAKKQNLKLNNQKEDLALKYEYYKTLLEEEHYKVVIEDGGYCYEADSHKTYKCR